MKMPLDQKMVLQMRLDKMPVPGTKPLSWTTCKENNYLLYDSHPDAPSGFAIRVGKNSSTYLLDKLVDGKKLKIRVGLAAGKKGTEAPISLAEARKRALDLLVQANRMRGNPVTMQKAKEASELTMDEVWDQYIASLKTRARPVKANSLDSIDKARKKLAHLKDRRVNSIKAQEVLELFDHHAIGLGHRTAAEAMGRWATAAVQMVLEREAHEALGQGREPTVKYNPFLALKIEKKYRTTRELEVDYRRKSIRNPLSFDRTVVPFLQAAWDYRRENALAADLVILSLLWGLRVGEACTLQWKDRVQPDQLGSARWVDLERGVVCITDPKNRSDHEFPIAPCALELLKIRRASVRPGVRWVFPSRSSKSNKGHYSDYKVALKTLQDRANALIEADQKIVHLRGHDLRRTFGAACEKLGFSDRQTKRMLGHSIGGGETVNRYTEPEWKDTAARMHKVETLMLKGAKDLYDALRVGGVKNLDTSDIVVPRSSEPRRRKTK